MGCSNTKFKIPFRYIDFISSKQRSEKIELFEIESGVNLDCHVCGDKMVLVLSNYRPIEYYSFGNKVTKLRLHAIQ